MEEDKIKIDTSHYDLIELGIRDKEPYIRFEDWGNMIFPTLELNKDDLQKLRNAINQILLKLKNR